MNLHTVMVTYDRLECTKQAIDSYLDTVTVPFSLTVVDNGSTDGTQEWLRDLPLPHGDIILLGENKYPGYATNRGWERAPRGTTFLHRADNDWAYYDGWCEQVMRAFKEPRVGQVGLRTQREEPVIYNVGGNCVIRKELWDQGLRYDERPWPEMDAGCSEDTYMGPAVRALGYQWTRVRQPCIYGISDERNRMTDPYYVRSYTARRIYGFK